MMKITYIFITLKCFCYSYGKLSLEKVKIFKIIQYIKVLKSFLSHAYCFKKTYFLKIKEIFIFLIIKALKVTG